MDIEDYLTERELSVYKVLKKHKGSIVPYEQIKDEVWGSKYYSNNNVSIVISRIRNKGAEIENIVGRGYKLISSIVLSPELVIDYDELKSIIVDLSDIVIKLNEVLKKK